MKIILAGISRTNTLIALYNNAKSLESELSGITRGVEPISELVSRVKLISENAKKEIEKCNKKKEYYFDRIDLGAGERDLKVNLTSFELDPTAYDSINGKGLAAKVIKDLRITTINEYKKAPKDSFAYLLAQTGLGILDKESGNQSESDEDESSDLELEEKMSVKLSLGK